MKVENYRAQMETQYGSAAERAKSAIEPAGAEAGVVGESDAWEAALRMLQDGDAPIALRQDALRTLGAGMFAGTAFAPFRPQFQSALRQIAVDDGADPGLRRSGLGVLTGMKDDTARSVLTNGLREPALAAVPPAVALEMLSLDDHAASADLARAALATSDEAAVRQQAVRILGADPAAKQQLREILRDKAEFREVRRSSAVALRALDTAGFETEAAAIVADPAEFPDIKATLDAVLNRTRQRPSGVE